MSDSTKNCSVCGREIQRREGMPDAMWNAIETCSTNCRASLMGIRVPLRTVGIRVPTETEKAIGRARQILRAQGMTVIGRYALRDDIENRIIVLYGDATQYETPGYTVESVDPTSI